MTKQRLRSPQTRSVRARTFTLIEVVVAAAVLTLILLGLIGTLSVDAQLRQQTRQSSLALGVLEAELDRLRPLAIETIVPLIRDAAPADEPRSVEEVVIRDAGGRLLLEGELTVEVLDELQTQEAFGLEAPPDLDGNEDPDDSERTAFPYIPVRLTLTWTTPDGPRTESVDTMLYQSARGS